MIEINILPLLGEIDTLIESLKKLLLFIVVVKNKNGCVKLTKLEVKIIILCFILLLLVCYAFQDILLQLSVSLWFSSIVK